MSVDNTHSEILYPIDVLKKYGLKDNDNYNEQNNDDLLLNQDNADI